MFAVQFKFIFFLIEPTKLNSVVQAYKSVLNFVISADLVIWIVLCLKGSLSLIKILVEIKQEPFWLEDLEL